MQRKTGLSAMNAEIAKAIEYSERLMGVAIDVVGASKVEIINERARDPKIVALTLLCRSISNFRAAMLLAQQGHVMEARALGRGLLENLLWVEALRERGTEFVQDMLSDEAFNRKSLGEATLRISKKHGADVTSSASLTLRNLIKDSAKAFPTAKKINASKTAAESVVELNYVDYARLSLDGVHCSITALGRHLSSERVAENRTELVVSVEARTSDAETLNLMMLACRALIGVAVGTKEMLGGASVSGQLGDLITEWEANGWTER
jgi:hypothetical protein